jgi:glycosyltransferase involved in cell wall biosynthesis
MKIVLSSGSRTWGGLEQMAEVLARGLQERGHELVLFCRTGSPLHQHLHRQMPCEPILHGSAFHPATIGHAVRALRRHRPDVAMGNTMKDPSWTGVAARFVGVPYVYRHEFDVPYPGKWGDRLAFGRVPARHVLLSGSARANVLGGAPWLPPERVRVIHNGVDVRVFDQAQPADLRLPEGAVVFGFVGRWDEQKGVRELADAWPWVVSAVPNAHLVIAGFGPLEREFRWWLDDVPNVHWLGFRRDVPSLMKAFDVLVLPSHREGFPLVPVEAMSAGAAVIATRIGGLAEIVTDGETGRLVPPQDSATLAEAMTELALDPALRRRLADAGRDRAHREFPVERMLNAHEALLREVVAERGTSRSGGGVYSSGLPRPRRSS